MIPKVALGFRRVKSAAKFPFRSATVGIVNVAGAEASPKPPVTGTLRRRISAEKKKNSLSRFLLKPIPGITTGPPIVPPGLWYLYGEGWPEIAAFVERLLKYV